MKLDGLHLLHTWLTDPSQFFSRLFTRLAVLSKRKQGLVTALTFFVPIATTGCLTVFSLKNAVVITVYRFIPQEWSPITFFGIFFLVILAIRGYHHLLLAAKRSPRKRGHLSRLLPPAIPALDHARNNLCMLPSLVVAACMALTFTSFTWNVYHYGLYLTFMFWFGLLWSGWLIGHSAIALPAIEGTSISPSTISSSSRILASPRDVRRVMITSAIAFLLFSLVLDAILPFLVGAERMPLFFKLAYVLMHGN